MSDDPEKKESIKVIDRRLFRPDGTRREPERGPESTSAPRAEGPRRSPEAASAGHEPIRGEGFTMEPGRGSEPAGGAVDAGDTMFVNLVVSIFQSGCIHLGLIEEPGSGPIPVDFDAARGSIEMLRALRQKTAGNLNSEESRILESLLAELQMSYAMKASDA